MRFFDREDVKAMANEIYRLARYPAPDFGMFSGPSRGRALDLMARFKISEGPALVTEAVKANPDQKVTVRGDRRTAYA